MSGHLFIACAGGMLALHLLTSAILKRIIAYRARRHDPYAEPFGDVPYSRSAGVALRSADAGGRGEQPLGAAVARMRSAS